MFLSWPAPLNMPSDIHCAQWLQDFICRVLKESVNGRVHTRECTGRWLCYLLSLFRLSCHCCLIPASFWLLAPRRPDIALTVETDLEPYFISQWSAQMNLRFSIPSLQIKFKAIIKRGRNIDPAVVLSQPFNDLTQKRTSSSWLLNVDAIRFETT